MGLREARGFEHVWAFKLGLRPRLVYFFQSSKLQTVFHRQGRAKKASLQSHCTLHTLRSVLSQLYCSLGVKARASEVLPQLQQL